MPVNSFKDYPMNWKPNIKNLKPPIYKALAKQLEADIQNGVLHPGDLLPPQRELADFLDLNLSTVTKAFKLCSQKGLISSNIGRGTYVSSDVQVNSTLLDPLSAAGLIELGAIYPDRAFDNCIQSLFTNFIKNKKLSPLLGYNPPSGTPYQKNIGVKWLSLCHVSSTSENILLTNGGQNALCVILASLFQPGDRIGTDPLTFSGIKTLAKMLHIQLIPIPNDNKKEAFSPEYLEQYCKTEGLKGIYVIPDFQNPMTYCMSIKRRQVLAEIAQKYRLIVIEDAINSLLSNQPSTAIASLLPEQTLYVSSLSKVICPGLQIAFIHTPLQYKAALETGLYNINLMVSPLNAEFACTLIHSSHCQNILTKRRELTIARNQLVDSILGNYHPLGSPECNFRLLHLPKGWTGKDFEQAATKSGVQVYCGERFAVGNSTVPAVIRLSITSPKNLMDLEKALHILYNLLHTKP